MGQPQPLAGDEPTTDHRTPVSAATDIAVLIVDDHAMVGQALAATVNRAPGMRCVGLVPDGEHALHAVKRDRVDLVLMDYNLPTADGVTWASTLKAQQGDLKVLILTGTTDTDHIIARAVGEGCDGFLSKAAGLDHLVTAIEKVHAGEPVFTSGQLLTAIRHLKPTGQGDQCLSDRELEVLQLMTSGATAAELGRRLSVSVHTVRSHTRHILEKLHAHSKLEAVAIAVSQGIITIPEPTGDR